MNKESKPLNADDVGRILQWVALIGVLLLAYFILGHLFYSFYHRVDYGFDLEWMEGGMLVHADRLRNGQGLYVAPSADFVPYIYPPLYPWVLSIVGEPSYAAGRWLSILGTLAAMAASVAALRQERVVWAIALVPPLLYATCYDDAGAFFDLVRSDSVALGFAAWSIVLVRRGAGNAPLWGGALLILAYMSKHNYAVLGVPMALWLWRFHGRRQALRFVAFTAGIALLWTGWMVYSTDGLFWTYLVEVPNTHPKVADRAWPAIQDEIAASMSLFVFAAAIGILGACTQRIVKDWEAVTYWLGIALVIFPFCALMRAHHGGFNNVLMPGFWLLAVLCCLILGGCVRNAIPRVQGGMTLAVVLLLSMHAKDPKILWEKERYVPTVEDRRSGERLVEFIRQQEGEVFMPQFAWYPALAGKKPSLPLIALWDISDHKEGPLRKEIRLLVREAMESKRWSMVITGRRNGLTRGPKDPYAFQKTYAPDNDQRLPIGQKGLRPKSGWRIWPTTVWVPKTSE